MSREEAAAEVIYANAADLNGTECDNLATAALAAADAVMFSEGAYKRVGEAIHRTVCGCGADELDCDDFGPDIPVAVNAVIEALRGTQP